MIRHCASHIKTSPKPPVLISAFLETVRQSSKLLLSRPCREHGASKAGWGWGTRPPVDKSARDVPRNLDISMFFYTIRNFAFPNIFQISAASFRGDTKFWEYVDFGVWIRYWCPICFAHWTIFDGVYRIVLLNDELPNVPPNTPFCNWRWPIAKTDSTQEQNSAPHPAVGAERLADVRNNWARFGFCSSFSISSTLCVKNGISSKTIRHSLQTV